jgi:hypothetical protein
MKMGHPCRHLSGVRFSFQGVRRISFCFPAMVVGTRDGSARDLNADHDARPLRSPTSQPNFPYSIQCFSDIILVKTTMIARIFPNRKGERQKSTAQLAFSNASNVLEIVHVHTQHHSTTSISKTTLAITAQRDLQTPLEIDVQREGTREFRRPSRPPNAPSAAHRP